MFGSAAVATMMQPAPPRRLRATLPVWENFGETCDMNDGFDEQMFRLAVAGIRHPPFDARKRAHKKGGPKPSFFSAASAAAVMVVVPMVVVPMMAVVARRGVIARGRIVTRRNITRTRVPAAPIGIADQPNVLDRSRHRTSGSNDASRRRRQRRSGTGKHHGTSDCRKARKRKLQTSHVLILLIKQPTAEFSLPSKNTILFIATIAARNVVTQTIFYERIFIKP